MPRKKRRLKPSVRRNLAARLRLRNRLRSKAVKDRFDAAKAEIFATVLERESKAIREMAIRRRITVKAAENLIKKSIRPMGRLGTEAARRTEDAWIEIRRGKNKGKFRNTITNKLKSAASVHKSIGMSRYWAQIKFIRGVFGITTKEARDSFDQAKNLPELVSPPKQVKQAA